ncbi:hypothetical protein [Nonomuraea polychroma]|uniref:hypothetical protein n=1 Tax=Nonomuraea polychroma TaxID=46176 RepID=UPI0013E2DC02|nr:hypothetical protein [Nonomuraea polychroma]
MPDRPGVREARRRRAAVPAPGHERDRRRAWIQTLVRTILLAEPLVEAIRSHLAGG